MALVVVVTVILNPDNSVVFLTPTLIHSSRTQKSQRKLLLVDRSS
ncbi:unnamed protein product [Acidithrix sp. C25]|nr:unnamed protein product [Acidithrix sp. C25]